MELPALAALALAALLGAYMLVRLLRGAAPPWPASLLHGAFAAIGLGLVINSATSPGGEPLLLASAGLLLAAALGGAVMFVIHLRGGPPPKALAVVHGLLAVGGFASLCAVATGLA